MTCDPRANGRFGQAQVDESLVGPPLTEPELASAVRTTATQRATLDGCLAS